MVRNGRIFVTYSASGSWTDEYKLGLLWADASSNLLDPHSWRKRSEPVFFASGVRGTFAAGHNSFFTSSDGAEDWILYHANAKPNGGWSKRAPRAQRFTWTSDGFPCFGAPAALDESHFEPVKTLEPRPVFDDLAWIPSLAETPVATEESGPVREHYSLAAESPHHPLLSRYDGETCS